MSTMSEWPRYPNLRIFDEENEYLREYFTSSLRKLWPTVNKLAQFLYEYEFEGGLSDDQPQLQARVSLSTTPWFDPEKSTERRWFSVLLEWGAPSDAWTNEEGERDSPEALIEIYENIDDKSLLKVAHSVIEAKDLHVKMHVGTL